MTRAAVIKILEAELVKPDLAADLRLKYASEIAILRGWQASQGRLIGLNKKPSRKSRKIALWDQWLRERCPAEYRPQHPAATMPFGIEDFMASYIKRQCRSRWTLKNLDAALQYAVEQVKQQPQVQPEE